MNLPTNPPPKTHEEYYVATSENLNEMIDIVNQRQQEGEWVVSGSMTIRHRQHGVTYYQPLKRKVRSAASNQIIPIAEDIRANVIGMLKDCGDMLKCKNSLHGNNLMSTYEDGIDDLFKEIHSRVIK